MDRLRKKLLYLAWHRGTKEMDLLLGSFAEKIIPSLNEEGLENFARFLECPDPELYEWFNGKKTFSQEPYCFFEDLRMRHVRCHS